MMNQGSNPKSLLYSHVTFERQVKFSGPNNILNSNVRRMSPIFPILTFCNPSKLTITAKLLLTHKYSSYCPKFALVNTFFFLFRMTFISLHPNHTHPPWPSWNPSHHLQKLPGSIKDEAISPSASKAIMWMVPIRHAP